MKLFTLSLAALTSLTGASWVYAGETVATLHNDFMAAATAQPVQPAATAISPELQTGLVVYTPDGEHIGSIRAIIRKGETVRHIWIGHQDYDADAVQFIDGMAVLETSISIASLTDTEMQQ